MQRVQSHQSQRQMLPIAKLKHGQDDNNVSAVRWCVLQQQQQPPDGNFLRLFESMTVCGPTVPPPPLPLPCSRTLQPFHFVSLKGVSEILPHLTLNDSCTAVLGHRDFRLRCHSLNDGIRRDSRESSTHTALGEREGEEQRGAQAKL